MHSKLESGFSAVEVLVVVVIVGAVGLVGWKVYNNQKSKDSQQASTQQQEGSAPAVNSASDLKATEDYLNSQDVDKELDTSELDEALAQ